MKKKIISLLLGLCMLFAGALVSAEGVTSQSDERVADFITKWQFANALPYESMEPTQKITRADFAVLVSEICGLGVRGAGENFFDEIFSSQDKSETLITEDMVVKSQFDDVDEAHYAYSYIKTVKDYNLMNGVSKTQFNPDGSITLNQALKVLVSALNYSVVAELRGGYPSGYYRVANEIKLLRNVSIGTNDEVDWVTAQHLLYNALHTRVFEQTNYGDSFSYTDENTDMLITKVFSVETVDGIITDNGISSLTGIGKAGDNGVKLGDKRYTVTDDTQYVKDWLGHSVTLYYYNGDTDYENRIVYGCISKNEVTITFPAEDYDKISGGSLYYYYNDGNNSKRVNLVGTPYVIKNGNALSSYDNSDFKFDDGNITLISWDNSKYSVIIANKTEYIMTDRVNTGEEIIYNKIRSSGTDTVNVIDLKKYEFVNIRDVNGESLTVSDIKQNDVLEISKGSNNVTVTVVRNVIDKFTINETSKDSKGKTLVANAEKEELKVTKQLLNASEKTELEVGDTYTLYLNSNNEVVWAEKTTASESGNYGVLTKCVKKSKSFSDEYYIQVYAGNDDFDHYELEEKISYNNTTVKAKDKFTELQGYYGAVVNFELNEENKVTSLVTPANFGDRSDRGFYRLNNPGTNLSYSGHAQNFQAKVIRGGKCVTFTVPESQDDYDDIENFQYNKASFSDNGSYKAEAYGFDYDTPVASFIVVQQQASGGTYKSDALVVDSIVQAVNDNDEVLYKIKGYGCNDDDDQTVKYREYFVTDNAKIVNVDYSVSTTHISLKDIEKGDVIRLGFNAKKYVETINVAYDYSADKFYTDPTSARGTYQYQTQYGWPYSVKSGYLRLCRETKPENIDFTNSQAVYDALLSYGIGSKVVTVKKGAGNVSVSMGSADDIITYLNTSDSSTCSKIVLLTRWTAYGYLIVVYN